MTCTCRGEFGFSWRSSAWCALVAGAVMAFGYIKAPALLLGVGRYTVTVELPAAGGLYASGNVTYRGTEVGRVTACASPTPVWRPCFR